MKAVLSFDLPEDQEMFDACQKGPDLKFAAQDFSNWLRAKEKQDVETISTAEVREIFYEFLGEFLS